MINELLHIKDMHCTGCAMRIESLEDDLPGIKEISASYQKQQVVVQFDESRLDIKSIISAIEKLGYHIEKS